VSSNCIRPADLPAGHRRTVLVAGIAPPPARPTLLPAVFRTAARLVAVNGHWQGDYLPDPFDRVTTTPHATRPLSIVAAVRCAATGSPRRTSDLSERAIEMLANRLEVDGEPAPFEPERLEWHVAAWGDAPGRTAECAVAVLEAAGDACEVHA
jgi:hypothetical protein